MADTGEMSAADRRKKLARAMPLPIGYAIRAFQKAVEEAAFAGAAMNAEEREALREAVTRKKIALTAAIKLHLPDA